MAGVPVAPPAPPCPVCGHPLGFVPQEGRWYCQACRQYRPPPAAVAPPPQGADVRWFQNAYRIRKKVLAIANQYWIEDPAGHVLGYSRQKLLRLKEDIRVFTDETMATELFRIQQQQIVDVWGNFAVVDSATNGVLGYVRRRALASVFVRDEWEVRDGANQLVGEMHEATGRGLARKYLPAGKFIPEKITLELGGQPVAEINQRFKIIGDIWEITVHRVPPTFDRRVLIACALLMGMVERDRT